VSDAILILNAGSSSLKFSLFEPSQVGSDPVELLRGNIQGLPDRPHFTARNAAGDVIDDVVWPATLDHEGALTFLLPWIAGGKAGAHRIVAAGHRIVHGGTRFIQPVRIYAAIVAEFEALVPLAPLHQPHNIAAVKTLLRQAPALPQIASFDTAFHRVQPRLAQLFALPRKYTDAGILRYGFHGLSYEYIASVLPSIDLKAAHGRTIVAHLGNGASMCAMHACRSVATTMSFTPLDGLVMGTRTGEIDPGVLLHLMRTEGASVTELEDLLYHRSGLLGVSGISSDMRVLLESNDVRAAEAIELFVYRAVREVGSLAAALGGVDALVFTGGIGENAGSIRARICSGIKWLGVEIDESANNRKEKRISNENSTVTVWVLPTDEELIIARHTQTLLP
jgi:acetate kinase